MNGTSSRDRRHGRRARERKLERQPLHLALLVALLLAIGGVAQWSPIRAGELHRIDTVWWATGALGVAIAHQLYVVVFWRWALERRRRTVLERGRDEPIAPVVFSVYVAGFFVLFVGRMVFTILVAVSNAEQLAIPIPLRIVVAVLLSVPGLYLFYSVYRHFGFLRAAGGDHFHPKYRDMPLVRAGIFRYSGNAMYTYGLLVLWIPGFITASPAALLVAGFQHAYIWVHYLCTEAPDMKRIYEGGL